METERELRDGDATTLHDVSLNKGNLEVVHILQLGERLPCIEDLVVPRCHL